MPVKSRLKAFRCSCTKVQVLRGVQLIPNHYGVQTMNKKPMNCIFIC
ncbi:hypothetical protein MNBD_ALPHA11-1782 [hydrothermal vent metagenome]|uniref:Uncharacterized protein n=1 Tax=hydrothermal vent metagenome TaxID=652676 RepID=A0A3B0TC42_9ZZZZ